MADQDNIVEGYTLRTCIATGGSSQVWEVTDPAGGGPYAMKILLPQAQEDPEQVKTLKHEAKLAQDFDHPNFLRAHHVIATKQLAFFIMDLFKAPTLKNRIRSDRIGLHLRLGTLVDQLAQALAYLHSKGYVHRDLKPDNVLFNKGGELKLIDFSLTIKTASGLSKFLGGKQKTIQGTRTYIAPETIRKESPQPQTDLYSFGVMLYEILTGNPPFRSPDPNALLKKHLREKPMKPSFHNPDVSPELDEFVLRLLSKKIEHRPADATEILAAFRGMTLFTRDIEEIAKESQGTSSLEDEQTLANRLDSRTDAARTAAGIVRPPVEKKKPLRRTPEPKEKPKPPQPAPGGTPTGAPPQGMPPGMPPNAYPPGMPYPPQGWPPQYMPPPGAPYPPMPAPAADGSPGQPAPYPYPYPPASGAPPVPNQPPPGQFPPGQVPPGQPPVAQPPAGQTPPGSPTVPPTPPENQPPLPGNPVSSGNTGESGEGPLRPSEAPHVPPAHPGILEGQQHPSQSEDDDDLPFMDELPEVR